MADYYFLLAGKAINVNMLWVSEQHVIINGLTRNTIWKCEEDKFFTVPLRTWHSRIYRALTAMRPVETIV